MKVYNPLTPGLRRTLCVRVAAFGLLIGVVAAILGCRASRPEDDTDTALSLKVDVVPLLLRADTSQTATVWVTVLERGSPAHDSTRVNLVATLGTVTSEVYTRDGLAVTAYRAGSEAGSAAIIAQVRGVRDTMRVTLY